MGLFDNIIGTASEDIEPLSMETITDDTQATGTGGSGTGTGGSGTGTGGSGTGNNIDTMINIDNISTGITTSNMASGATMSNSGNDDIPNIDIGGDMDFSSLGINTDEVIKSDEIVVIAGEVNEAPKIEHNIETITDITITDSTNTTPVIDTDIGLSESKIVAENNTTTTPVETGSTFSLLDNSITTVAQAAIVEPITDTSTIATASLIDIVPEFKQETPSATISETISPSEIAPSSGISPLSSLNLGYQKNHQETINHEPLSVRIAAFLKELEELKSNDEVTRTKLEQELLQIRADEKKINDAISLLNNIKNI